MAMKGLLNLWKKTMDGKNKFKNLKIIQNQASRNVHSQQKQEVLTRVAMILSQALILSYGHN